VIRVLVAEDQGAVRAGLVLILGSAPPTSRSSGRHLADVLVLTTFDLDE
jgi:hypothetical protein